MAQHVYITHEDGSVTVIDAATNVIITVIHPEEGAAMRSGTTHPLLLATELRNADATHGTLGRGSRRPTAPNVAVRRAVEWKIFVKEDLYPCAGGPQQGIYTLFLLRKGKRIGKLPAMLGPGTPRFEPRYTSYWLSSFTSFKFTNTVLPWGREYFYRLRPSHSSPVVRVLRDSSGRKARFIFNRVGNKTYYRREGSAPDSGRLIEVCMNPFGRFATPLLPYGDNVMLHGTAAFPCGRECCDGLFNNETHGCIRTSNDGIAWLRNTIGDGEAQIIVQVRP